MLTQQAKKECQYQKEQIKKALMRGDLTNEQRQQLARKLESIRAVINEMNKLETECER